jgi:DNA-binding response OmpR family regulator
MQPPERDEAYKATVLVIDNDEGVLAAVSRRLEHAGYQCITAVTGAQGVEAFDPDRIDAVLTDLNMPVLDGLGVIRQLRRQSDVPIIVMTGFRRDYAPLLRRTPGILLCEKPFSVQNLLDLLETELYIGRCNKAA